MFAANSICCSGEFSKPALSYRYIFFSSFHCVEDAKSTPKETSFPKVYPKFSIAKAEASKAFSLSSFGAHPPSSPRPFVNVGSCFCRTLRNSLCTNRLVSIAS